MKMKTKGTMSDLNYDRAMNKKLSACGVDYFVKRAEKGENQVFLKTFQQPCMNYIEISYLNIFTE